MNDGTDRRAVLRVSHDVDRDGKVIRTQLEPLPDAPREDVVWAAWQAARRCHPWIVGGEALEQLESAQKIALAQVNHLMDTAVETLDVVGRGFEHATFGRLRDAVTDLRGYLPALYGNMHAATAPRENWRNVWTA